MSKPGVLPARGLNAGTLGLEGAVFSPSPKHSAAQPAWVRPEDKSLAHQASEAPSSFPREIKRTWVISLFCFPGGGWADRETHTASLVREFSHLVTACFRPGCPGIYKKSPAPRELTVWWQRQADSEFVTAVGQTSREAGQADRRLL